MELVFQATQLRYLRRIAHELRYQEETADTIVPDSYPDIAAIADCYACAVLRGKDCRDGSVTLSGGVKAAILYEPEDGSGARRLELYLPFTTKLEQHALTERSQVQCSVRVRSVDARMINSRKAMLRVNLGCEITAYEEAEEDLYTLQGEYPALQTKETACTVSLPLEACERSFVVSDTLELPAGRPAIEEIYKVSCQAEVTDRKLVGNKGVFKGTLWCKILYQSEDHQLQLWQQQLPFSQYCELQQDYDEEQLSVLPAVTGYDLELEPGTDNRQVLLTVHMLAQCLIAGARSLRLVEDAYAVGGTLQPEWKSYDLEGSLDRQNSVQSVRQSLSGQMREVLDVDVYQDHPVCQQSDDISRVSVPLYLRVLGMDSDGRMCSLTGKAEAVQEFALSDQAQVRCSVQPVSDAYASVTGDGVEVRCSVGIQTDCMAGQSMRSLCGGKIEAGENQEARPSVILRLAGGEENLWSIAKACGAAVASVKAANRLDSDRIPSGTMLLIPIG